jgi:N-acetylglucosaminyldiphosphoundecaprenol N-acetyl-beta-D-mannosaminyltransferase
LAQKDEEYKMGLNQADLAIPDGTGLILASWFLGNKLKQRITGVDFVWQLCGLAEKLDKSIYFLGGQNGAGQAAAEVLTKKFPRLKTFYGGDNLSPADFKIITDIKEKNPQILLVAFGHGQQEKWIINNLKQLSSVDVAMGVGGTFDFIGGKVKRAPLFLRRIGLEWLWRLILQPWRWQRILTATVKFSWLVVKEKTTNNKIPNSNQ